MTELWKLLSRHWLWVLLALGMLGGGYLLRWNLDRVDAKVLQVAGDAASARRYRVPLGDAPTQGRADALVTVVEFADLLLRLLRAVGKGSSGSSPQVRRSNPLGLQAFSQRAASRADRRRGGPGAGAVLGADRSDLRDAPLPQARARGSRPLGRARSAPLSRGDEGPGGAGATPARPAARSAARHPRDAKLLHQRTAAAGLLSRRLPRAGAAAGDGSRAALDRQGGAQGQACTSGWPGRPTCRREETGKTAPCRLVYGRWRGRSRPVANTAWIRYSPGNSPLKT